MPAPRGQRAASSSSRRACSARVALLALGFLLGAMSAAADVTTGALVGIVRGADDVAVAGAAVELASRNLPVATTTAKDGRFRFEYLAPGVYDVRVTVRGSADSWRRSGVVVRASERVRLTVRLDQDPANTVPTADFGSIPHGIGGDRALLGGLPLGRSAVAAFALSSAVSDGGLGPANPSIAGASGLDSAVIIDGVRVNDAGFGAAGSYSVVLGPTGLGLGLDTLADATVELSGFDPEQGSLLGGVVNLVTRSDGAQFSFGVDAHVQPAALEGDRRASERQAATADVVETGEWNFGVEVAGPVRGGRGAYAASLQPRRTTTERRSAAAVRTTGIDHGLAADREVLSYAGSLRLQPSERSTGRLSVFGDPGRGPRGPHRTSAFAVPDPDTRRSDLSYGGHNVSARWSGQVGAGWFLEQGLGWHLDQFSERLADDTARGTDRRASVDIAYGGAGMTADTRSRNLQFRLASSSFFELKGEHNLRIGVDAERIAYRNTVSYSGPAGLVLPGGIVTTSGYEWSIDARRFEVSRVRSGPLEDETRARDWSMWLSDSWHLTDWLSITAGARVEAAAVEGANAEFHLGPHIAPRVYVVVDPLRDGRGKLWAAGGRFYARMPNQFAVRAFGGETTHLARWLPNAVDLSDPTNPRISGPPFEVFTFNDVPIPVDPDARPTAQDEFEVGAERDLGRAVTVRASVTMHELRRVLEDVGDLSYSAHIRNVEGGNFIITNPSKAGGQIDPERSYRAFTLAIDRRLRDRWQLAGSYTWSRLEGNYEGFYRLDNGQEIPGLSSMFDWPYLEDPEVWAHVIAAGPLPNDRSHTLSVYGAVLLPRELRLGLGLRVMSGMPLTRLGYNEAYGTDGEIPLEPRGASGRGATVSTLDLHLDYPIQVGAVRVALSTEVFNLLDQQKGLQYHLRYERGGVVTPHPSLGIAPCPGCVDPDFGLPETRQEPRQIRFGVRLSVGG